MDWKLILRIAAIITLMYMLLSSVAGCKKEAEPIIDWDDCSQQIGDHPCDFTLLDQNGNEFKLYDHYGKIIIIDFSAMWCGPCQMAALEVEEIQKKYDDKVVYVTILVENLNYNPPSKSDLRKWAKTLGIQSAPVLAGSRSMISSDPDSGWLVNAWPTFYIIDQNMVMVDGFKGFYRGLIETIIEANLESDTGSP